MNDTLDESGRQLLTTLRDSVSDIDRPASLEQVMARGQQLRQRRRIARGVAGTCLTLVLAVTTLAFTLPAHPDVTARPDGTDRTARPVRQLNVELAGWSVRTNPDATLTITLRDPHLFDFEHPQLLDADRLRATLASAGIPVVLEFHDLTAAQGLTNIDCHQGPDEMALTERVVVADRMGSAQANTWVITLRPAEMPRGAVLQLFLSPGRTTIFDRTGAMTGHGYGWAASAVVYPGTPRPCTLTSEPGWPTPEAPAT